MSKRKRNASIGKNLPPELLAQLIAVVRAQIRAHLAYNHKALLSGRVKK